MLTILPSHVFVFRSADGSATAYSFTFPFTVFVSRSSGGNATGYSFTYSSNHTMYMDAMKMATLGRANISSYTFPYSVWVTQSAYGNATGYSFTYSSNHTAGAYVNIMIKMHKEETVNLKKTIKQFLSIR